MNEPIPAPSPARGLVLLTIGLATALIPGCADGTEGPATEAPSATVITGARIFTGTGDAAIEGGAIVVEEGRIAWVGPAAEAPTPTGARMVDMTGRTIVPGLINAHGHVGGTLGLETGHYTTENLERQLRLYAEYGVTTVVSLGGDRPEGVTLHRAQEVPALGRSRVFTAGEVVTGDTPEAAIQVVDRNADMGVDFIKIRVDDNLGTTAKMAPDVYQAVIDRAHERGLKIASHLFYLTDAKALLRAGTDLIAHSVRDRPVDDELVELLRESGVCYVPTLTREVSTFAYGSAPAFFSDSFFLWRADPAVVEALNDPARQRGVRDNPASEAYAEALQVAMDNVGTLADAGIPIALGTDTGPPGRFQGYFEHMELGMMADAGMSALEVLEAATAAPARCLGLEDVGTLEPGKWADLVVVRENPLEDIRHLRSIEAVWIGGAPVPRA